MWRIIRGWGQTATVARRAVVCPAVSLTNIRYLFWPLPLRALQDSHCLSQAEACDD